MKCDCGDSIHPAACGEGWCHDCFWVHFNISCEKQDVYCFCKAHRKIVEHAYHCKRWEAKE